MPQSRAIPTIANTSDLQSFLKNYQQSLSGAISSAITPIAPYNFQATSARGGIQLAWSPIVNPATSMPSSLPGADGYEIQRSTDGDFSPGGYTSIPLRDPTQSSYFDSVGGAATKYYYRIRATNGTPSNPYTVNGIFSGTVTVTSIDATDTMTAPTTSNDTFTSPSTQSRARNWQSGVNSPFQ